MLIDFPNSFNEEPIINALSLKNPGCPNKVSFSLVVVLVMIVPLTFFVVTLVTSSGSLMNPERNPVDFPCV